MAGDLLGWEVKPREGSASQQPSPLRGSSCGLRCPCLATRASSWERPRHCPPLWNQVSWGLGWSPLHERGSRPLRPIDPPTPDKLGTARNVPKICTGFPGAGPAQQSPAARTPRCSVGDHLCLLAGARSDGLSASRRPARRLPPRCGQEGREVAGQGGGGEPSRRDSARLQPQPPTAQPQAGAAGVNLEAWEGQALSPGPPEAAT